MPQSAWSISTRAASSWATALLQESMSWVDIEITALRCPSAVIPVLVR